VLSPGSRVEFILIGPPSGARAYARTTCFDSGPSGDPIPRMEYTGWREPLLRQCFHPLPGNVAFMALPFYGLSPNADNIPPEGPDRASVGRDSVVREVTAHYLSKPSPLLRNRVVHSLVHQLFNRLQRSPHAVSARLPLEGESADFVPTADMRKTVSHHPGRTVAFFA
jgi:hypothetical protein